MLWVHNVGLWVLLFFHNLSIGPTEMGFICELVMHMTCFGFDFLISCYVFFLTIGVFPRPAIVLCTNICSGFSGFGDFALVSPAGRVIFVVCKSIPAINSQVFDNTLYIDSLMAVPIVASFAVQTVTKIVTIFPLVYMPYYSPHPLARNVVRTTPYQTKGSPHWPYIRR